MSHRLQITLEDDQSIALTAEIAQTGISMAELVRQAVEARLALDPASNGPTVSLAPRLCGGDVTDRPDDPRLP